MELLKVYLPDGDAQALRALAAARRLSVSSLIRTLLVAALPLPSAQAGGAR